MPKFSVYVRLQKGAGALHICTTATTKNLKKKNMYIKDFFFGKKQKNVRRIRSRGIGNSSAWNGDNDVFSVLQCVAVCCSMLQYVSVRSGVLSCDAACCSVLQRVAACCSVLQCVVVCYRSTGNTNAWNGDKDGRSVLQCAAVRCSVLQCDAACCSVLQCVVMCCSASHEYWQK